MLGVVNRVVLGLALATVLFVQTLPAFADEMTVEYKLAVIQRNAYVSPDDPLVFRFADLLDQMTYKCQESREQIGNGAANGAADLQQKGVYETPLSLLQGWNTAVPYELYSPDRPARCAEFLGLLELLLVDDQ